MTMLPKTVGELRRYLETYPDDLALFAQNNTEVDPNATPQHFVVEFWDSPDADPPLLLFAIVELNADGTVYPANDPNASWSLPK